MPDRWDIPCSPPAHDSLALTFLLIMMYMTLPPMFTFPLPLGWGPQIVVFKKIFENQLLVAPQRVPIVDIFFEALETLNTEILSCSYLLYVNSMSM